MIKQQKTFAIGFGIAFVVMLVLYFVVVAPLLVEEEAEAVVLETVEGEEVGSNDRYLMFPQVERSGIQSIEVHNEYGGYTFYRDSSDNFVLKGYEGMAYDQELFASYIVSAGYTLAMMKITDNATPEQMKEYGLDNPQAYWILTTTEGDVHQVNVGDILVTEGGYYCSYEGRDTVYILSTTLADTMLQPVEKMITPLLTAGMSQNDYFEADNFTIWHGEDLFIRLVNKEESEKSNPDAIVESKMTYPAPYVPNTNLYYEILYNFMALQGTETVKIGPTDEELEKYGLANPAYTISYTFQDIPFYIFVSELQKDGTYYAVSNLYGYQLVAKVGADMLGFVDYGLFKWISEYPFQAYVTSVDTMQVVSGDGELDVSFKLTHGTNEEGNATLEVDCSDGQHIDNNNIYNFRQFYKTLLSVILQEYTPLSEEEKTALTSDPKNLLLTFTYTTLNGETTEFKFYQYTTRRAFVTVNGVGEFYCYVDLMEKIISDTEKVLDGMDINSYGKS